MHPYDSDLLGHPLRYDHTHGHCVLHLPAAGAVIAGDGIARSTSLYERLDGNVLLAGHGDPWHGTPADAAARARAAGAS